METTIREHALKLENNTLNISGVVAVKYFEQNEVMLELAENTLRIKGEGLELIDLSIKSGNIIVQGRVTELAYGKAREKGSVLKKLFK